MIREIVVDTFSLRFRQSSEKSNERLEPQNDAFKDAFPFISILDPSGVSTFRIQDPY